MHKPKLFRTPDAVQVLTAWVAQAGDDAPEWLVGIYATV